MALARNILESNPDYNATNDDPQDGVGSPQDGEVLYASTANQSYNDLVATVYGLIRRLGYVPATRRGADPPEGASVALSGTWTTDGGDPTLINGVGGAATTELVIGDYVTPATGIVPSVVSNVVGNDQIQVVRAFDVPLAGAAIKRIGNLATRIKAIDDIQYWGPPGSTNIYNTNAGTVGIGGPSTGEKFHVTGNQENVGKLRVGKLGTIYHASSSVQSAAFGLAPGQTDGEIGVHANGEVFRIKVGAADGLVTLSSFIGALAYLPVTGGFSTAYLRDITTTLDMMGSVIGGGNFYARPYNFVGVSSILKSSLTNYEAILCVKHTSIADVVEAGESNTIIYLSTPAGAPVVCSGTLYYKCSG